MRVSLRVSFTEEKFNFLFYSLKDLISEIGGLGGAIAGFLGQFGVYIMMLFVVDLVMVIRRKYKQKKRMHNLVIIVSVRNCLSSKRLCCQGSLPLECKFHRLNSKEFKG